MKAVSLYIHIPFCNSKCSYCDFLSFSDINNQEKEYINAVINELSLYKVLMKDRILVTIFIGGGTPSSISSKLIEKVLKYVFMNFNIQDNAEITIEANPESITAEKARKYLAAGINRISMGVQSFDEKELKLLGRIHRAEDAINAFYILREAGFSNINIDLMFGLPNQNINTYYKTLEKAMELEPEHISAYGLIIEPNTPFYEKYGNDADEVFDEDIEREMYNLTKSVLRTKEFYQYEISNYSKIGYECRHNKVYWTLGEYFGVGLGAASFNSISDKLLRYENVNSFKKYLEIFSELRLNENNNINQIRIETIEILSNSWKNKTEATVYSRMEEYMFLGMRLINGIDKNEFEKTFNIKIEKVYKEALIKLKNKNLIIEEENRIFLTEKGIDVSNYVLSEFIGIEK